MIQFWHYKLKKQTISIERTSDTRFISLKDLAFLAQVSGKKILREFDSLLDHGVCSKKQMRRENQPTGNPQKPGEMKVETSFDVNAAFPLLYEFSPKRAVKFQIWFTKQIENESNAGEEHLRSFFTSEEGNPKMHECYTVFADLLGYKNLILNSDPNDQTLLLRLNEALHKANKFLAPYDSDYPNLSIKYFSDCVSILKPVSPGEDPFAESSFGHAALATCAWQLQMVLEGFFVRGGFSVGPMYRDQFSLFGKPHVEAYVLESSHAVFPRIVISREVAQKVYGQMNYYDDEVETPQECELIVDSDGMIFFNYLDAVVEEYPDFSEADLQRHKDLVEKCLTESIDSGIIRKYEWTARYHNWYCSTPQSKAWGWDKYMIGKVVGEYRNIRQYLKK